MLDKKSFSFFVYIFCQVFVSKSLTKKAETKKEKLFLSGFFCQAFETKNVLHSNDKNFVFVRVSVFQMLKIKRK